MTFPSLKLSSEIVCTGGLATGGGVGIYQFIKSYEKIETPKKKPILDLLDQATKDKKITKENKSNQNAIQRWKDYINANKTGSQINAQDKLGIKDWTTAKNTEGTIPDSFIEACEGQLTIKVNGKEDQHFKNYLNWCITQ